MADWFTHTLIGWITGKTTRTDIALVVIGSLLPDLSKLNIALSILGVSDSSLFDPLHTPIGALLIAGLIALIFPNLKKAFLALLLGLSTHFLLDFFLIHPHSSMTLLFPFSWEAWQIPVYTSDDYRVTILALVAALLIYIGYRYHERKKNQSYTQNQNNSE